MHAKWPTVSSKKVYSNPYFKITENHVVRSNGKPGIYYVVDRYGPFSIVIPLFPDKTTLLVGQYRVASDYYSWELPMGHVRGKTPPAMAKQELKEETGYSAKSWKQIGRFFTGQGHTNQEAFVYTATDLIAGKPNPEPGEDLKIKRVKISVVVDMIKNGKIKDGPTIVAWHLLMGLPY